MRKCPDPELINHEGFKKIFEFVRDNNDLVWCKEGFYVGDNFYSVMLETKNKYKIDIIYFKNTEAYKVVVLNPENKIYFIEHYIENWMTIIAIIILLLKIE